MPGRRRYSPREEEVFRILNGFPRRRQLLTSLERERSALYRRMEELLDHPAKQVASVPVPPDGYSWTARARETLTRDLEQVIQEQALYDELLDCLDPFERRVVRLRHEEQKSWCALARTVYLCERQAQRVYRKAIERMAGQGRLSLHAPATAGAKRNWGP